MIVDANEKTLSTLPWLWLGGLAMLPLLLAALYLLLAPRQLLGRYDGQYFGAAYQQKYDGFDEVVAAGLDLVRDPDVDLYRELSGLVEPDGVPGVGLEGEVRLIRLMDDEPPHYRIVRYYEQAGSRSVVHFFTAVNGRWVMAPKDAYFYFHSGLWIQTWMPLSVSWWVLLLGIFITLLIRQWAMQWRRPHLMPPLKKVN